MQITSGMSEAELIALGASVAADGEIGYPEYASDAQIAAITAYLDGKSPQTNEALRTKILEVEKKQARAVREAMLNQPGATDRLAVFDTEIAALRARLT